MPHASQGGQSIDEMHRSGTHQRSGRSLNRRARLRRHVRCLDKIESIECVLEERLRLLANWKRVSKLRRDSCRKFTRIAASGKIQM